MLRNKALRNIALLPSTANDDPLGGSSPALFFEAAK
jgi:hypothetical protein